MENNFLVRQYIKNSDKSNSRADTLEDAEKLLGVTEQDRKQQVPWLNQVDHYYNGTRNYIRQTL